MAQLTARPSLLKQANLSLIRRTIKSKGTATRAEIAEETNISSTTVRSLLNEMLKDREIEGIGYDESSGGRKAERYRLKPDRYHCAAFCISGEEIHALLINVCGEIVDISYLDVEGGDYEKGIFGYLDRLDAEWEIRAIGIGAPGIVEGSGYWREDSESRELYWTDIGTLLSERYQAPVLLENDLNAIAIGFGKCYEEEFKSEQPEFTNMAYVRFEKGCISAGFISGGRIIRGCSNFAGELGLVMAGEDGLPDINTMDDVQYTKRLVQLLSWICGILNPEYIALGGPDLRTGCVSDAGSILASLLPGQMAAEILYAEDIWQDYHKGMAFLTSEKMFDHVHFIKE